VKPRLEPEPAGQLSKVKQAQDKERFDREQSGLPEKRSKKAARSQPSQIKQGKTTTRSRSRRRRRAPGPSLIPTSLHPKISATR
jgi:hypothetical protein